MDMERKIVKMIRFTLYVPEPELREVERLATESGITSSQFVREGIRQRIGTNDMVKNLRERIYKPKLKV